MINFPLEINNYREIFLGGGSVLLTLLSYVKSGLIKINGIIYAYDLNDALINVYKNIQQTPDEVYDEIMKIIIEFNNCNDKLKGSGLGSGLGSGSGKKKIQCLPINIEEALLSKENYYYWIRSLYNKSTTIQKNTPTGSAMFIFLNKTCFRGVFRVGPNGFNVPYGNYNSPEIINKEHLNDMHKLIKNVVFECLDFKVSLTNIENNDYVYIDPPYASDNKNSFVGYTLNGFTTDNHNELFSLIHQLTNSNINIMLSNADVNMVRENFTDKKYKINSILCKRQINSKNPADKASEVIITNY
jgi:DNA adenine methylase